MTVRSTTYPIADSRSRLSLTSTRSRGRERPTCGPSDAGRRFVATFGVTCLAALLTLSLIGCEAASSGDDEHHHDHSHDLHRATFAESVAEIQGRSARFASDQAPADASLREWEMRKLVDLIRKLPELAADTELKRPEWDRVDAISKELLTLVQPRADSSGNEPPLDASRIAALSAELEQMASLNKSLGP
jgi:hypothetical protein